MNDSTDVDAFLEVESLRHSFEWTIALTTAYLFIFLAGIIGNSLVILVFVMRPQMRTVTNMFIVNLAVADLFVNVFCVPATLLSNVFIPWYLGSFLCKWVAYVQGVSVFASSWSLVAISLDRCRAIRRPMERAHGLSKSESIRLIFLIWLIPILVTTPWLFVFDTFPYEPDNITICVEMWTNDHHGKTYFLIVNLTLCYILPFILISGLNIHIWWNVSRRKAPQNSASHQTLQTVHRNTRKAVRRMLSLVTCVFLVSWFPLFFFATIVKFSLWCSELLDTLIPISQLTGFSNSSINPILYAFLNSKFRKMFKSVLRSCLPLCMQPQFIRQTTVGSQHPLARGNGSVMILLNRDAKGSQVSSRANTWKCNNNRATNPTAAMENGRALRISGSSVNVISSP